LGHPPPLRYGAASRPKHFLNPEGGWCWRTATIPPKTFNREPREIREQLFRKSFRVFGVFRGYQFQSLFS